MIYSSSEDCCHTDMARQSIQLPEKRVKWGICDDGATLYSLGNISGVGTTKSSGSMCLSSLCATPSICRTGIVIGIPPTQPRFVGGSAIFIDFQVVMTLPRNAAQSWQLVDCAVCSLVGGGGFLMTPLSHADQSW